MNKRTFLQTGAIIGGAAMLSGTMNNIGAIAADKQEPLGCFSVHELPKLPYDYKALEPVIDEQTLTIHHTKHHNGYVTGLNNAEEQLANIRGNGKLGEAEYWTKKLAFHGAGNFLHTLYWESMSPNGGGAPKGVLSEKIIAGFGSFEIFKAEFEKVASSVEGSGWGLLAFRPEDKLLFILQVEKHQDLSPWNMIPIMAVDVWEHAYYLKYQNKRGEYLTKWWDIANWNGINSKLEKLLNRY